MVAYIAAVTEFWGFRIHREQREVLAYEAEQGRLRQGWGYDDRLDLRLVAERLDALDDEERDIWRRQWRMLVGREGAMQQGDVVVVPHLVEPGAWTFLRVVGDYEFDMLALADGSGSDYGHIVPVRVLVAAASPLNDAVSAELRGAMKARLRMWNLSRHRDSLERLLASADPGAASSDEDRLGVVRERAMEAIEHALRDRYNGAQFERPVKRLLEASFGVPEVQHTGGPAEAGADLVCDFVDPLGAPQRLLVQVKMWADAGRDGDLLYALDQIQRAVEYYEGASQAVVLTLLDDYSAAVEDKLSSLSRDLGIPVRLMTKEQVLPLFLRYLSVLD